MKDVFGKVATVAAFAMIVAMLAGCSLTSREAQIVEKIVVIKPKVPKSLTDCDKDKPVYRYADVTLKKSFAFTDEAMKWGERCSSKNKAIGKFVEVE